jgi:putative aldouronate transport system permease protein
MQGTRRVLGKRLLESWQLYVLLIPALLFIGVFRYGPMYGLQLAFKSFNVKLGITRSPGIGLAHFVRLFSYYRFAEIFVNTLILAAYKLAA